MVRSGDSLPRSGKRQSVKPTELPTVSDFVRAMEQLAPKGLEQSWDNVGLLIGDGDALVRKVLLAIDLTRAVLKEAVQSNVDILVCYHPPIFKGMNSLRVQSSGMDSLVYDCIQSGIAIYSPHTALDAAAGGTNDVLAAACGAVEVTPLTNADAPGPALVKVVVYVPTPNVDKVAQSMFDAGAGHIGKYSHCSFRAIGIGTFLGGPDANPAIGQRGRLERVEEVRLESIVPRTRLAAVVAAMRASHPYEEPAFDLYAILPQPTSGIGRVGRLPRPLSLSALGRKITATTKTTRIQLVGQPGQSIERVVVVAGAAGSLPFQIPLTTTDAIVTGEMRHHDALTVGRIGCGAVVLGHWASERPVLPSLASRLGRLLPGVNCKVSRMDRDPYL